MIEDYLDHALRAGTPREHARGGLPELGRDPAAGLTSILVATDTATVTTEHRAHDEAITVGTVSGSTASPSAGQSGPERGQVGAERHGVAPTKQRAPSTSTTGAASATGRCGALTATHPDGPMTVRPTTGTGSVCGCRRLRRPVRGPRVRDHTRARRASPSIPVTPWEPGASREAFYVAITAAGTLRRRLPRRIGGAGYCHPAPRRNPRSGRQ